MLATVRTVIVDEIHALARDKRGSHLALSLERLEALTGRPVQRIGLSATQKPLDEVGRFLVGAGRDCALVDAGTFRALDLGDRGAAFAARDRLLARAVGGDLRAHRRARARAPHDARLRQHAQDGRAHRRRSSRGSWARTPSRATTAASRASAASTPSSGSRRASCARSSRRRRSSSASTSATSTSSIQVGATRSIATFLQRVGRAGHALRKMPKGRLFPLTLDELVEARGAPALRSASGVLDRTPQPPRPLDILAQQIVAAVRRRAPGTRRRSSRRFRRAWPYRDLSREEFDAVVALHTHGRRALLHRDGVNGRLHGDASARGSRRCSPAARSPTPPTTRCVSSPRATLVGTVNEDWAIESNARRHLPARQRVLAHPAHRAGDRARGRREGAAAVAPVLAGRGARAARASSRREIGDAARESAGAGSEAANALRLACGDAMPEAGATQIAEYVAAGVQALGAVPTPRARHPRALLRRERRHAARRARAVRRRGSTARGAWRCASASASASASSCRRRPTRRRSSSRSGRSTASRSRRSSTTCTRRPRATCSCRRCSRRRCSRRAGAGTRSARCSSSARAAARRCRRRSCACAPNDLLVDGVPRRSSPAPRRSPGGPIEVPMDHPIVRQTIEDCLTRGDGRRRLPRGAARPARRLDREAAPSTPSSPRRSRAGSSRRSPTRSSTTRRSRSAARRRCISRASLRPPHRRRARRARSPTRSRACARRPGRSPRAPRRSTRRSSGWATSRRRRAAPGRPWLDELAAAGRVVRRRRPLVRGRGAARSEGGPARPARGARARSSRDRSERFPSSRRRASSCARGSTDSAAWCDRRLLARIHRYTLDRLRKEIEPVTAAAVPALPRRWQHADRRSTASRARAASPRSSRSSRASRSRPRPGRRASCPPACAATGASGSTS